MCEISHQSTPELEVAQTLDEWEVTCKGGVGGGEGGAKIQSLLYILEVYYL